MNPFQPQNLINKNLHEIISKLQKRSETTKQKALQQLYENIDLIDENTLYDIVKILFPLLTHHLAYDILKNLALKYKNNEFIVPIIPNLQLIAVENNDKCFLQNFNLKDSYDVLELMIDYEKNVIVYFRILIFGSYFKDISKFLYRDFRKYNLNNLVELKYIQKLLSKIEISDEMFELIENIKATNCLNLKWQILKQFEVNSEMFIRDGKYLDLETIRELSFVNFKGFICKDINVLEFVFDQTKDLQILFDFVNAQKINSQNLNFNIHKFCQDYQELNKSINFDNLNVIYTNMHKTNTLLDKKKTLINLNFEQTIERSFCINYILDFEPEVSDVDLNIEKSVYVLPVSYFEKNLHKFKNQRIIFKKYPGLITKEFIRQIIYDKKVFLEFVTFIKNLEIQKYIIQYLRLYYKAEDYIYVYDNLKIPEYLQILFYFQLYDIKDMQIDKIDAECIIDEYLNIDFIIHLLQINKLSFNEFIKTLYQRIGQLQINNSTFYKNEFYYMNSYFYENIQVLPFDTKTKEYLEYLLKLLLKIIEIEKKNNSHIFLIFLICEILQKQEPQLELEITEKVIQNIFSTKSFYALKVLFDLEKRFLVTFEDIRDLVTKMELRCEYLDYKTKTTVENIYVNLYLQLTTGKIDIQLIERCMKLKNQRLHNKIFEILEFNKYNEIVNLNFTKNSTTEDLKDLSLHKKTIFAEDTNFLSIKAIKNIFTYKNDFVDFGSILNALKDDYAFTVDVERQNFIIQQLEPVFQQISNEFINIFSLTRYEENADKKEVFSLMTANIQFLKNVNTHAEFTWCIFLNSIQKIRNINILFFLEKMVSHLEFKVINSNTQMLYAFNLPNISKNKINLCKFIENESKYKIPNMNVTLLKKPAGYIIKAEYKYEDSTFNCRIELDSNNISKSTFETTSFQKDLLVVKMKMLTKKSYKYMEILSIWKINIDYKMQGMKECLICYLTVDDNKFPDFECKSCSNKFHQKCLSRWADRSVKFTCPLCRGKFR